MMELDPKYVDVIVKRWEDFTGQKACRVEVPHADDAEAANSVDGVDQRAMAT